MEPPVVTVLLADHPGRALQVPFKDDEVVLCLLQRVSTLLGEVDDEIYGRAAYMNGIRMRDEQKPLSHYRLFGNNITYKAWKKKGNISITIQMLSGRQIPISCNDTDSVKHLKRLLRLVEKLPLFVTRLVFGGKVLVDHARLVDCGIHEGSVVYLVLCLRGGPAMEFADVSDNNNVQKLEFSDEAPPGRVAWPGMNVECQCSCTPDYLVICPKSFGIIELTEEIFNCRVCAQRNDKVVPVTVGFTECQYRFFGIKESGEQFTSDWRDVAPEDQYQQFDQNKQTTWKRLAIQAKERKVDDDCAICLESMHLVEPLSCGHRFHKVCYSSWNEQCPICRFNV